MKKTIEISEACILEAEMDAWRNGDMGNGGDPINIKIDLSKTQIEANINDDDILTIKSYGTAESKCLKILFRELLTLLISEFGDN